MDLSAAVVQAALVVVVGRHLSEITILEEVGFTPELVVSWVVGQDFDAVVCYWGQVKGEQREARPCVRPRGRWRGEGRTESP